MKQMFFMVPTMAIGTLGSFFSHPYQGVLIYYLYAVLRPQFIWQWSLPLVAWSFYVSLCAILATIAWRIGILDFDGDENKLSNNIGHYSVFAFATWISLTYFTARHPEVSYPFFIEYLKMFTMFIVARYAIAYLQHVWFIYLSITITLCYIAYEVNEIYLSLGYLYVYRRGYGGLDNNGAALMLAMGVPLCLYAWDGIRHWVRWGFLLFIPVIIHAVLTSYSRGAMLATVLCIPLFYMRCRSKKQLAIILLGIAAIMPFLAGKEIQERFFSIQQHDIDESANSRRKSWSIAIQMATESPIVGFGIRNSNLYTYAYGADMEGRTIHSQWLQTAADSGYVALGLYLVCYVGMYLCCRRVRKALGKRDDYDARRARIIVNGCEGALVLFAIGATFLSLENFELPYILFLLAAQIWSICQATNSFTDAGQAGQAIDEQSQCEQH
ncbi:MAG: O-antigen ligase family protein [Planctomycetia bacterium]|nr:O-antigen ligase family protein [Planctomycetia bacterium]